MVATLISGSIPPGRQINRRGDYLKELDPAVLARLDDGLADGAAFATWYKDLKATERRSVDQHLIYRAKGGKHHGAVDALKLVETLLSKGIALRKVLLKQVCEAVVNDRYDIGGHHATAKKILSQIN
jgi:hypothetical protein